MRSLFKKSLIVTALLMVAVYAFPKGDALAGGATGKNPAVTLNLLVGDLDRGELEVDFKLGDKMSLAPRLFSDFDWYNGLGASLRFGIAGGKRPHGLWVGPSLEFIFWDTIFKKSTQITLAGEFGWRYTLDFGLTLQPLIRIGFGSGGIDLYGQAGAGIGYAF